MEVEEEINHWFQKSNNWEFSENSQSSSNAPNHICKGCFGICFQGPDFCFIKIDVDQISFVNNNNAYWGSSLARP